jgi:pimeloyl-ACP methyl ester carboxylesterase
LPTLELNGRIYTFSDVGSGEPIVHICGGETDWQSGMTTRPLATIPRLEKVAALTNSYRVISYAQQVSKGPGGEPIGSMTRPVERGGVLRASDDCLALMQRLNIDKAHIFAHSLVTPIALDLAVRAPDKVVTIAMHEPMMFHYGWVMRKIEARAQRTMQSREMRAQLDPSKSAAPQWGDVNPGLGPGERELLADANPSDTKGFTSVLGHSDVAGTGADPSKFQMDTYLMSLLEVSTETIVDRIKQPVLSMLNFYSSKDSKKSDALLKSLLPQTESYLVPKPAHFWKGFEEVGDVATGLLDFLKRYSMRWSQ